MRSRTAGVILAVLGVICLAAAAVLAWVVAPSRAKLPGDLNVTRQYDGTVKIALNAGALAAGDASRALIVNKPVTVDRVVKVLATDGNTAQVQDSRTATLGTGDQLGVSTATYAVDRKSLEATTSHPSDWQVASAEGLTVSFPIGAKKQTYTGWVTDIEATTPINFVKEENHAGVNTYVYQAQTKATPIKNPQVLSALPTALPVDQLPNLLSQIPLPDTVKSQITQALPGVTGPLPLNYTYAQTSTYWVEPTTGSVVDLQREEIRKAGVTLPNGTALPSIVPIYDVMTKGTQASVDSAAADAKQKADSLTAVRKTWPMWLLIAGVILLVVGVVLLVIPSRRSTSAPPAQPGT
jgi:hypothetical protein